MDFFWRFLDFLAKYKCNMLVFELGGGMEYKRHPEINETWVKFCKAQLSYDFDNDPYDSNPHTDQFKDAKREVLMYTYVIC